MKKALIVGLNNYPDNELNWCDNDATAIKQLLETNGDGSPNFDIRLITETCNAEHLEKSIRELFEGNNDISLLYFSGHGADIEGGYLCTTDFSKSCYGVRMDEILNITNNSKCKNKVIILDCCFAAKMGEALLTNNSSILGDGVTIMAASQNWQSSEEKFDLKHGLFTYLVLEGLKGGAADILGNITPASLYTFVDQSLGAWQQRPVFKTNISHFLSLRTIPTKVSKNLLRKLNRYFINSTDEYALDPSYEFTNNPSVSHEVIEPYANEDNVAKFKELQMLESIGLVEPVNSEHMYFAAMERKSCKLTALGLHYWNLAKDKRF